MMCAVCHPSAVPLVCNGPLNRELRLFGTPLRNELQQLESVNCYLSANSGLPAITVPGGFTADGFPVGIELLGRPWSESTLIKLAYAYEQATRHRRPPASTPALAARGR